MTLDELRRHAVSRSLFPPTSLQKALEALGFVQADPIRAPARAQDLTLRHRVTNYRAGDLERRYPRLNAHEDFFINYGFVTDRVFHLMHPRRGAAPWSGRRATHVKRLLEFIRDRGPVHPREVDAHFSLGSVTNYWGGSSSATTHLLDAMHYRGLLRVVRPVVWDRRRFELLWNWPYRFEAYTPVSKRRWGYYALPLLWRDRAIGWANASVAGRVLAITVGFVSRRPPRDRQFRQALQDECQRLGTCLNLANVRHRVMKRHE